MATPLVLLLPCSPSSATTLLFPNISSPIAKPFPFFSELKLKRLHAQHPSPPSLLTCSSSKNEHQQQLHQEGFSMLETEVPWEDGSVWSTLGLYLFSLHIPLSFGGLSALSNFLQQPHLHPQTKAVSVLVIQSLELCSTLVLLGFTSKPECGQFRLLNPKKLQNERNWLLASLLGFALLLLIVFLTSYLANSLVGAKDVNDPVLKEILSSGSVSVTACVLVYCLITPMLEEIVYRRFLLTFLASTMKWQQAVIISSAIFSAAHLSSENFFQLFIIGSVLGCAYCWTGDLRSSIALHSLYNALTLLVTFLA